MHDAMDVGAQPINQQVHRDLAGNASLARYALAVHIDNNHVRGVHPPLADTGGGHENMILVEADRQVSVCGGNKTIAVQHAAVLHNREPMLAGASHKENLARPWYSTP